MKTDDICDIINTATLRAHRRFLGWARYAALAIPESYIQSECYRSLGRKYGRQTDLIMEPRLRNINFDYRGKLDLVIGNFFEPNIPIPLFVVEFKKGGGISKDYHRIKQMNKHYPDLTGIISAYICGENERSLDNKIKIIKSKTDYIKAYKSPVVNTIRRDRVVAGEMVSGYPAVICNICLQI